MKIFPTSRAKAKKIIILLGLIFVSAQIFSPEIRGQKRKPKAKIVKTSPKSRAVLPKVTQIDETAFKNLLKRTGEKAKPLLVNFWATWCDPCREEFPEFVKIDGDYREKIDFVVISMDDLAEIKRDVPKFLADMKATMPAYLLKTEGKEATLASAFKDWKGGLPFTVLLDAKGETVYSRQGKIKPDILRSEIDKVLTNATAKQTP